ncbi:uncharacterized protein [Palaemon carinicauda]|uniref:uncharacterized protein n=1 Tax=Palaemon carinicauda TaxID=392227 RepID=UPI0035B5C5EE
MALQMHLESCSLCLRDIAKQRHIKGNICLKYSGSSASEVVAYIVGQAVPIVSLCFRCYRLLLGIDYHQHEFKRLKDSIVKIYCERCTPLEEPSSNTCGTDPADSKILGAKGPLSMCKDLGYNSQDVDVNRCSIKIEIMREEVKESVVKLDTVFTSEQTSIQEIPKEKSSISKVCSVSVRSSKRSKKEKKLHDFEYYADVSKDDVKSVSESAQDPNTENCVSVNDNSKKNYCTFCSKDFVVRKDYLNHSCIRSIRKLISFKCKACQMSFSVRRNYIKHINSCYKNVPVKCNLCLTELQSAAYLPRHLEAFHNAEAVAQKSSLCDLCGRTFSRKEALQRHQAKVHRVSYGTHQCAKCGQTFLHTSLLMEHIRAHRGYPCPECNKIFTCMSNLKVHRQTYHQNKTLYVCSTCNKRWRFHTSYTNHMRKIHGKAQFKCPTCKLPFSAENAFERHKLVCAGVYKRPIPNKNPQTGISLKGKKDPISLSGEVAGNFVYGNRTRMPVMAPKDSTNNYNSAHDKSYLRLKKVVRNVSSSVKHHTALQSKDVIPIGKKSNSLLNETEMFKNYSNRHNSYSTSSTEKVLVPSVLSEDDHLINVDASVNSPTEIVVETVEDLNSDCQLVILVGDGSDEHK